MAPKRSTPREDPPSSSSSEEEEEGEEVEEEETGGESDSTDEEEANEKGKGGPTTAQDKKTRKPLSSLPPPPPPPPPPPLTQPAKPASKNKDLNAAQRGKEDDESESSESEADSDAERPANRKIKKPISSKPMVEADSPAKTAKLRSKSSTAAASPKPVASAKRGPETDRYEKDAKRAKKKDLEEDGIASTGGEKSDGKKQLFQRLWSEEDEIVVLRGVIDFEGKKGIEPAKDMPAFYDFIKNSLHVDVTQAQLKDKVWRLKKKFKNHVKKGKNGEEKMFTKDHDQKAFDLSKKIWGSEGMVSKGSVAGGESGVKSDGKLKKGGNEKANVKTSSELKEQVELAPYKGKKRENLGFDMEMMLGVGKLEMNGGMEEYVLRKGMEMMDDAKREEMGERLRKLLVGDIKLFLKRNELVLENAQLLLAAYSKNDED